MVLRENTRRVQVGNLSIGGGSDIVVQSMLNIPASRPEDCIEQARCLKEAGCELVRLAVPDMEAVRLIDRLKSAVEIPLVADIHFDYRLALESAAAGIDKIRINPGNIGARDRVKQVADCCRLRKIPIRIGVNSGSLEKHILQKYGHPTPEALVESALYHIGLLEQFDFTDIIVSIKSSSVKTMLDSYRLMAHSANYPLHLGVTEAGGARMGLIKSAAGIGSLLADGIGDTIRVSLTADPVEEILAAKDILKAVGLNKKGATVISCPTCGRTKIDLIAIADEVERRLAAVEKPITVAVMGCVVNGPGEAREADIGIAGGDGVAVLFKKGVVVRKLRQEDIVEELLQEIEQL